MEYITKQPLPVKIPGTDIVVEASPDEHGGWRFIQDNGKSLLQILYKDSLNPNSLPILQPDPIHRLWNGLRVIYEEGEDSIPFFSPDRDKDVAQFMRHFYDKGSMPEGAEVGDLEPTLEQLHHEMKYENLFMNALVVMRNDSGLVANLNGVQLPKTIRPVSVYTTIPILLKDQSYDISLKEFQNAGGKIVAHGIYDAPSIFSEYKKDYGDIEAIRWMLGNCEVDGPSNTYDIMPIGSGMWGIGVLRGRKLTRLEEKS